MSTHRLQRGLRVTFLGMAANIVLAAVKFIAGVLGNSHALVADAVESFADIFSSLIVWRGLVVAAAPADEDHPYGHGKAEPLAAAIVATFMLVAAAGIALHSLRSFFAGPHDPPKPFTLVVLVVIILVKEVFFRVVSREAKKLGSAAVNSDAWHHRSDAITSLAAAIGITVALFAGKGYESADDVAAVVAAGIIAWNGWQLLRPALNELMDTVPDPALRAQISAIAAAVPDVRLVEKCLVRKVGYHFFVDMHVHVDPLMTVERAHAIAHAVKDAVRMQLPAVSDVLVHVEPAKPASKQP